MNARDLRLQTEVKRLGKAISKAETERAAAIARAEAAEVATQRLFDLVRHQRSELFHAGLITKEEYSTLASTHGGVQRLETYDDLRAKLAAAESDNAALKVALQDLLNGCWDARLRASYGRP